MTTFKITKLRFLYQSLSSDIDATCSGFDNGTILHIAASNLCFDAAKCLVSQSIVRLYTNYKVGPVQILWAVHLSLTTNLF